MAGDNEHIHFTAADIERYIKGQMSAREMYALEKAAHEDPFLAEALEGYFNAPEPNIQPTLAAIKSVLDDKIAAAPVVPIRRHRNRWLSVAAAILLITGTATTWYLLRPAATDNIAQKTKLKEQQPQTDAAADSNVKPLPLRYDPTKSAETIAEPKSETDSTVLPTAKNRITEQPALAKRPAQNATIKPASPLADQQLAAKNITTEAEASQQPTVQAAQAKNNAKLSSPANDGHLESASTKAYVFLGTITDSGSRPLPFVNLSIPGTGTNTYSDAQGRFRILSGDSSLTLHLKAAGFKEKEVLLAQANGRSKIQLQAKTAALDEIVVSAYGLKKQKNAKTPTQAKDKNNEDAEAEPLDGWFNYEIYLQNNSRISPGEGNLQIGNVELSFTVDRFGSVSDFRIDLSNCAICDNEAIRLVKQGPRWKITNNHTTARVTLTIYF